MIDNTMFFLLLSPFALCVLGVMVYSIVVLWRLRHSPLEKAREMATGAKEGVLFLAALLFSNLLCWVILRPFILQRYSADALTFGLLLVDIFGGYALVVLFARIWIAKRRVRQLEVQSQEKSF